LGQSFWFHLNNKKKEPKRLAEEGKKGEDYMNECHFILTSTPFFSGGDCRSLSDGIEKKNKQDPLNLPAYGLQKGRVNIVIFFLFFFISSNLQQALHHHHRHH
jgi:hypothetical protein